MLLHGDSGYSAPQCDVMRALLVLYRFWYCIYANLQNDIACTRLWLKFTVSALLRWVCNLFGTFPFFNYGWTLLDFVKMGFYAVDYFYRMCQAVPTLK
jgi:hypothetical protein